MPEVKSARRGRNLTQAILYTLIFTAILVTVNFLAKRYTKSYDTTANKRYTLSEQSQKITRGLKDDLKITYWDRPEQFQHARDLFDRYQNLSPKVSVAYQDPDKNRVAAKAAGIATYGTTIITVGNKREEAKSLTEEDVTGAIVRTIKGGDRKVCYTLGSGEGSPDDTQKADGYGRAKELTEKNNYKTATIKLLEKAEIPMDCTIVVVGGPKKDYIQPVVDALKKFVEDGGRALFMLDPPLKIARNEVDDNAALVGVLNSWGVKPQKNLVLDLSGVGQLFGLGAEAPLVTSYQDHSIVREMKEVPTLFPITQSVEGMDTDKTKVSALLATGDSSRATKNLSSPQIAISQGDAKGPFTLAVAGTYTTGKETGNGRFVFVGTSQWIQNGYLNFNGNRDLYMNMLNWLSSDEDLISIRPREPENRPLNMNARQVRTLFYASVLGIPLLIVMGGIGVWWKRR